MSQDLGKGKWWGASHTINRQVVRRLAHNRLRIRRQCVLAIDLALAAVDGGGTGPKINVVFTTLPIGC